MEVVTSPTNGQMLMVVLLKMNSLHAERSPGRVRDQKLSLEIVWVGCLRMLTTHPRAVVVFHVKQHTTGGHSNCEGPFGRDELSG